MFSKKYLWLLCITYFSMTLPRWYEKEARTPNSFSPVGLPTRNTIISGMVGSYKTRFIVESISHALLTNHVLVLDVHTEYPGAPRFPKLSPSLVSVDFLQHLLHSSAAYLPDLVDCLAAGEHPAIFLQSSNLSTAQQSYFMHSWKRIQNLLGTGEDVIELLNREKYVRIIFDPDYSTEQLYLVLRQLIHDSSNLTNGLVVIAEELEKLHDIDQSRIIEEFIMAGRKNGMYLVMVTHMPRLLLMQTFGTAFLQFDSLSFFHSDGSFRHDTIQRSYQGVL